MSAYFDVLIPTLFGSGTAGQVGKCVKDEGCKKVLFIYDGTLPGQLVEVVTKSLEAEGIAYVTYDGVIPDVPDYTVEEACKIAREAGEVDCIVGLGGGSTMDTCKASNLLLNNPGKISDYYRINGGVAKNPGMPLFLIPTTAGAGSECAAAAVITDTSIGGVKRSILSRVSCRATLAIVDPLLTLTMPKDQTVITAYDAFSHAFECYTSDDNCMSPVTDACSIMALKDVVEYLPKVLEHPDNIEYREKMAYAANLSGICCGNAHANKGHAVGHALGSTTHAPHAVCVSAALAHTAKRITKDYYDRVKYMAVEVFGRSVPEGMSAEELGELIAACLRDFEEKVGMPSIKDYGATREKVMATEELIATDPLFKSGRTAIDRDGIRDILEEICRYYQLS